MILNDFAPLALTGPIPDPATWTDPYESPPDAGDEQPQELPPERPSAKSLEKFFRRIGSRRRKTPTRPEGPVIRFS